MEKQLDYYIYVDIDQQHLPEIEELKLKQQLLNRLLLVVPHVLKKTKRCLPQKKVSRIDKWRFGKGYPFRNGEMSETKGSIVWTDYGVRYWPLTLVLLQSHSGKSYTLLKESITQQNGKQLNADKVIELLKDLPQKRLIETDELDRWYDEVSATLIQAKSYHELYYWFGADVQRIGYTAFDFYMKERDTLLAWHKAIDIHMDSYHNLPSYERNYLTERFIKPVMQMA